jgi:hypothetical protein
VTAFGLWALAWPPVLAVAWMLPDRLMFPDLPPAFGVSWAGGGAGVMAAGLLELQWIIVLTGAAHVGIGLVIWWRRRRRRRRALAVPGAKSRALLATLIRRLRETLAPRPVLSPVPA